MSLTLQIIIIVSQILFSAVITLIVWRTQKKLDKREKTQDQRQAEFSQMLLLLVQGSKLSMEGLETLGSCVKSGKVNGEIDEMLEKDKKHMEKQSEFLSKTAVTYLQK